jgi:tetratricopeptide (TPR) repeat protein
MSEALELESGPEGESGAGPISPSAAMAIGIRKARAGAKPDPEFDAFLRKQSRLIDLQTEHLHEQRELILSRLRWGRFSDRLKALLQTLTVLVGLSVAGGVAVMAWQAHEDRSLVIESFSTPQAFAEQGLGGDVLSQDLMSRLDVMNQLATSNSLSAAGDAHVESHDEIKVEVPETGVSVGEVMKLLRNWLGAERRVHGSLRPTPGGGVVLTGWLEGHEAVKVSGAPAEIEDLERQLAERLYAEAEPANNIIYLRSTGRLAEARAAIAAWAQIARGRFDRASAYTIWSGMMDAPRGLALDRMSLRINPGFMASRYVGLVFERELGHEEAALAWAREELAQKAADQPPENRGHGMAYMRAFARYQMADLEGDYGRAVLDQTLASINRELLEAYRAAKLHDLAAARTLLAAASLSVSGPLAGVDRPTWDVSGAPWIVGASPAAALTRVRYEIDAAAGDWAAVDTDACSLAARAEAAIAAEPTEAQPGHRQVEQASIAPLLAEARARLADLDGAAASIAATPLDCYACLRERGRIAAMRRDWAAVDRWFAAADRQGPSLPFADTDWGEALLAKGAQDGAIARFEQAHRRSPRFADPLELWGEALMRKGDYQAASARFAAADREAPRWGRNHLMWGEALMLSGRYAEARRQYQAASGMDLSKPDRAALNVFLARTSAGPLHG